MSAESTISSYISTLTAQKSELVNTALNLASNAASAVYGFATPSQDLLGYEDFEVEWVEAAAPSVASVFYTVSSIPSPRDREIPETRIDVDENDFPDKPDLLTDDLDDLDAPSTKVTSFTSQVPNVSTSVRTITVPNIKDFDELDLLPVTLPDTDIDVILPTFDSQAPTFLGEDSYDLRSQTNADFDQALAEIRSVGGEKLDNFLLEHFPQYQAQITDLDTYVAGVIDGDTTAWALQSTIYDKRRTQTEAERGRLDEELARRRARSGSVVDMALSAASLRMEQAAHDANVRAAYEVAEQKADREQKHLEVVLNLLRSLREAAVQAWLAYNNIILAEHAEARQFAQLMLDTAVQAHNLAVARYNGDIAVYRADAEVFEQKLKSALVEYELLDAELKVLQATNDANDSLVKQRIAEIEAEGQKIDLYTAQIRGLAEELALRRFPLEIFDARIRRHEAYLKSRQTEADIYQALVNGQRTIADIDRARVGLYETEADVWAKRIAALVEKQSVVINANRDLREQVAMELDVIRTEIARDQASNRDDIDVAQQAIDVWREQQRLRLDNAERTSRDQRTVHEGRIQYDRMLTDYILGILNHGFQRARSIADVHNQAAATIGDLGAAAMAANGSNVSLINETLTST